MAELGLSDESTSTVGSRRMTPDQGIALWLDLMNACEQFLLAGLRRKVGPDGDLAIAYREWYAQRMAEHDEMILRMVRRLGDLDGRHVK